LKSENYAKERTDSAKGCVFTIIEFIFKKTATEFYDHVINNKLFQGYEIFVLSGTIIEARRKEIINFIKDERNRNKKVLLITTQVVEAGVDIDMDLGFKNQSLPDSDEQLAGRVNRNVKKNNCELYLFRIDEPKTIYGKDYRYKIALNYSPLEIEKLLQEKNFKKLYDQVIEKINKEEIKKFGKEDFTEYFNSFKKLQFNDIDREFRLIESESSSIFVPVDIDVLNYQFQNKKDNNFEEEEIRFIKENDCFADKNELKVSGEKIWNLFLQFVQNKNLDFTTKIKDKKVLNGIMSKFVFTVFTRNINDLKEYLEYNEDNHDFKYIQYYKLSKQNIGYDKIYDYYGGLNVSKIKKSYDIF
jgi:CRISPR-associated endonuclease/helicase Cas3